MAGCPLPGSTVVLSGSGHPAIAVCGPSRRGRRRHLTPQRRTESQVCKTDAYVARANFYRAKARAVDAAATRAATAATRSPPPPLAGGHCGHTAADAADHGGTLECDIPFDDLDLDDVHIPADAMDEEMYKAALNDIANILDGYTKMIAAARRKAPVSCQQVAVQANLQEFLVKVTSFLSRVTDLTQRMPVNAILMHNHLDDSDAYLSKLSKEWLHFEGFVKFFAESGEPDTDAKPPEKRQRIAKNAKLENAIFQLTSEIDHADAKSALLRVELKHVEVQLFGQLQETTKTEMKKRELKNDIFRLTSQIDHASKEIFKLEATGKRALLTEDLESELWA
jgi:predicted  nucleic acid-binding Zn-ribbon protein